MSEGINASNHGIGNAVMSSPNGSRGQEMGSISGARETGLFNRGDSASEVSVPHVRGTKVADNLMDVVKTEGIHEAMVRLQEGDMRENPADRDSKHKPFMQKPGDGVDAIIVSEPEEKESAVDHLAKKIEKKLDHEKTSDEKVIIPDTVAQDPDFKKAWGEAYKDISKDNQTTNIYDVDRRALDTYYDKKVEDAIQKQDITDPEYYKLLGEECEKVVRHAKESGEELDMSQVEDAEKRAMRKYLEKKDQREENPEGNPEEQDDGKIKSKKERKMNRKERLDSIITDLELMMDERGFPPEYKEVLELLKQLIEGREVGKRIDEKGVILALLSILLMLLEPIAEESMKPAA